MLEKFSNTELAALKQGLTEAVIDARQGAELLQMFLAGRGYGVSRDEAMDSVTRLEGCGCSFEAIQQELEHLALIN